MQSLTKLILLSFILSVFTLTSCKDLEFRSRDNVVAQVGNKYLYKKEIQNLIPPGTSYNDSILMLKQYVNSWALKYLLLNKAQAELSKTDKDVENELEEYRNSLIAYRYEKQYLEIRLDTVVTESEAREYYMNNSQNILLSNSVVKGRVIKISSGSPNLERIKNLYKANSLEEIDELERLCYNSADRYNNFGNEWVDLTSVARELPIDLYWCENQLKNSNYIESEDSLYNYFAFFTERVEPNKTPPFEFYFPKIKEIIIGKRKQNLIKELERDLIKEALKNNTIKTNINDTPKNENQR
ncbi:MAG: hypothetical protein WCR71_05525 [Bacteroidales bacterium]